MLNEAAQLSILPFMDFMPVLVSATNNVVLWWKHFNRIAVKMSVWVFSLLWLRAYFLDDKALFNSIIDF